MVQPIDGVEVPAEQQGVTFEEVAAWAAGLDAVHARIAGRFRRREPQERALAYLKGLLSGVERKNSWHIAEYVGDATPDGVQRLLNRYVWDADLVRDDLRSYVVEHLSDPEAVQVIDETGFLKKGDKSVGVQRQYCGTAGRIENCQIGVFLAYASPKGRAFIDLELRVRVPEVWAHDAARRKEVAVPREVTFAIKPELARRMLARARVAGVVTPWVTGDEVYGSDKELRTWMEAHQQAYVLAVRRNEYVGLAGNGLVWSVAVDEVVRGRAPTAWQRLSAGDGAKGPRLYEWARVQLDEPVADGWCRWLLVRRSLTDPTEMAYYRVFAPADTPLPELVRVAGLRWAIEDCFETAKGEIGLDQYEVRHWTSWYRHITLALLAHAYLTVMRAQTLPTADEKGG